MDSGATSELDLLPLLKAVAGVGPALPHLEATWAEPERFYGALLASRSQGRTALKSAPGAGTDLYHDLVAPNLGQAREAMLFRSGLAWRRISFDELHALSTQLAGTWEKLGVEPGKKVAIALPVGAEYLLALLTALRLGAVVSVLPPRGEAFLTRRLAALEPDHVVSHVRYVPLLGEWNRGPLPTSPDETVPGIARTRSHTYPPEEPAALLFSPLSKTPHLPLSCSAEALLRGAVRDALVTLGLTSQDRFALPGFDPLQFQPSALFASLFAGACFVELDEAGLADVEQLRQAAPRVLGVTAKGREILLAQVEPPPLRLWLRNPAEPFDWERWARFARQANDVRPCRGMNFVASAAQGGSLLFSPQVQDPQLSVLPAPGEPWLLADVNLSGEPATSGTSGLYAPDGADEEGASCGHFLIARTRHGYNFSGSLDSLWRGQVYPSLEVAALVQRHPSVLGASVVVTPEGSELNRTRATLLVFLDPLGKAIAEAGTIQRELETRLALELGEGALPDLFRFFPLAPKRTEEGAVDDLWCRWQFLGGTLGRKAGEEVFRATSRLRVLASLIARPDTRAQGS